ncbi:hypothetical protein MUO71_05905, partial [Candidatus Bathyarchaeota archaeon]|nr:hypothetical protein [Candidatus Bathyarchaeota archaeon]
TTNQFTCNHTEWRIIWEYVPNPQNSNLTSFIVFTYPIKQGSRGSTYINCIIRNGAENTKGISNIHDYQGTFTLNVNVVETKSYSIIIEQNLQAIPEFPSWIILPLFLIASLFAIVIKNRAPHQTHKR